jgi:hypothetical protein
MLVVVVKDDVDVRHVGTMSKISTWDTFSHYHELEFTPSMNINKIAMCTVLRAFENFLGPGEGSYYENDRNQELPNLKYRKELSYSNSLIALHTHFWQDLGTSRMMSKLR